MSHAEELLQFVQAASGAKTVNALSHLVQQATRKLGFDHFALAHHVNIYHGGFETVFLHNYPEAWAATLHVHEYLRDDPVAEVCRRQSAPFLWSDIPSLIQMSARQRKIMREAARAGLVNGYTVPVHMPGEPIGSCTFCATGALPAAALGVAMSIGIFAFEVARRLVQQRHAPAQTPAAAPPPRRRLSKRERDCILLASRGSSIREISQILGIGEVMVSRHLDDARRKYGAATAMELVARALYRSDLKFEDLIDVDAEPSGLAMTRRSAPAGEEPAPMARLGALFFGTNPNLN